MSAAGRGAKRSKNDFYETPEFPILRFIESIKLPGGKWLEPGIGNGAIVRVINKVRKDIKWYGQDIRKECKNQLKDLKLKQFIVDDFLGTPAPRHKYDVVITNPPYTYALEFIKRAFRFGKIIIMLLRINFLGSGARHSGRRAKFLRKYPPDVYVIPNRPSFMVGGGTDATEYAWMVWHGKKRREFGKLKILRLTPKKERLNLT